MVTRSTSIESVMLKVKEMSRSHAGIGSIIRERPMSMRKGVPMPFVINFDRFSFVNAAFRSINRTPPRGNYTD